MHWRVFVILVNPLAAKGSRRNDGRRSIESKVCLSLSLSLEFFDLARRVFSPAPPPPLPDFYVVEDTLTYTKKGEKKHFTVQNRHGQFKMVRISGVTAPFQCKARVMNMP